MQHLNRATDFFITPDHRIKFALLGALCQVDRVLLQRLALFFGIWVIDFLATTHVIDRLFQRLLAQVARTQQFTNAAFVFDRSQNEQLARDILVLALLRELVGHIQQAAEIMGYLHIALRALDPRHAIHLFEQL